MVDQLAPRPAAVLDPRTVRDLTQLLDAELSGSLNTRRTVLRILDLVRTRVADWAMLALAEQRSLTLHLYGGADPLFTASTRRADRSSGLRRVVGSGRHEVATIDPGVDLDVALDGLLPHPQLREEVASLGHAAVLAVPLGARGSAVGVLVLARRGVEGFAPEDVAVVRQLGARAALALDSARIYEDHARVTRVLEDSLRPPALPDIPGLDVAACFRAGASHLAVGGDFYDVHGDGDDWLVVLGDVCGKGVEAAVLNGRARQSIRTAAHFDRRPSQILATLNDVLYEDDSDRFVTVVCARVRPAAAGRFTVDVAVAGHPAPLVVRAGGLVEQPEVAGRLAGALPVEDGYRQVTLELGPGDSLVLFSDGIHEARGEDGLYGLDRLRALLARYADTGAGTIVEALERDVVEHLDDRGHDDMTALVVSVRTPAR